MLTLGTRNLTLVVGPPVPGTNVHKRYKYSHTVKQRQESEANIAASVARKAI